MSKDSFSKEAQLQELREIRSLMERSSRFISLSGLSGVGAGTTALVGAALGYWRIRQHQAGHGSVLGLSLRWELIGIALLVLAVALSVGAFFTIKEARKQGQSIVDQSSKLLIANLLIPLGVGGAFCGILLYHNLEQLVAPATLIFYGLSLINASKYTLNDIRFLGFCQIGLGLLNAIWWSENNGLLFWALGFGVLHIVYGIFMHLKYNR